MEVILKQPIRNLGDADDVVKVKPGYARNYLIPQGLAVMATASAKRDLDERKRQASHKQTFIKEKAEAEAAKLEGVEVDIETLAGADGKLFGSVTALQVANKLKEKGIEVERKAITLDDIRNTGEYIAVIHFHKEVKSEVKVTVTRREDQ
jgi:large subunit ribosomal protein L9